jgi:hypothetical protein
VERVYARFAGMPQRRDQRLNGFGLDVSVLEIVVTAQLVEDKMKTGSL